MSPAGARVVLVVGASSGIGFATARAFAERGEHLVLASRSADALQETARRCTADGAASALVVPADVCDGVAVDALVDAVLEAHGRIDVVVHSATVMAYGDAEVLPAKVFEQVVDTAVHGTANLARAVLPVMRRQQRGALIVVNSIVGQIAAPHMGAYATAKWGQLGLARTLQLETRDAAGVHVSVVVPGGVDTPIYYQAANYAGRVGRPHRRWIPRPRSPAPSCGAPTGRDGRCRWGRSTTSWCSASGCCPGPTTGWSPR